MKKADKLQKELEKYKSVNVMINWISFDKVLWVILAFQVEKEQAWHGKIAKWKILNMTKRTLSVKNLAFAVLESKHQYSWLYFGARIETKMVSAGFTFLQA